MRKEVICYVTTNEEGEEISVQRVSEDTSFVLLRLGQTRLVLNKAELVNAIETCDFYGTAFDKEKEIQDNKANLERSRQLAAANKKAHEVLKTVPVKKKGKTSSEEEGTIILDQDFSRGPTASELALNKITSKMSGDEIVIKDKK